MAAGQDSITRRGFLGAAIGTAALEAACGSSGADQAGPADGGSADGGATATGGAGPSSGGTGAPGAGGTSTGGAASGGSSGEGGARVSVGIVARASVEEAVLRAIELGGGISAIQPGQTVFIKPNAVSDRALGTAGIRTSPEVLAAVVRAVRARNPGRIIVGDRSARQFPDTERVFQSSGLGDAALAAGADEIYAARSPLDAPDDWVLVQPPSYEGTWGAAGGILAMRRILDADHLVNVPACKDHRYALFTMAMKNFVGAIGDPSRDPLHFAETLGGNFESIGRDIAVLNQIFSPLISIVDATTALVNGGPQGDGADAVITRPGLVLASSDRVALDAFGVCLIQHELQSASVPNPDAANPVLLRDRAWQLPQIVNAGLLGVGVTSAAAVDLRFDGVDAALASALETRFRA